MTPLEAFALACLTALTAAAVGLTLHDLRRDLDRALDRIAALETHKVARHLAQGRIIR